MTVYRHLALINHNNLMISKQVLSKLKPILFNISNKTLVNYNNNTNKSQ